LGYQFNSGALGFAFNIDLISDLIGKKWEMKNYE
jgi:hypothetical protein